MITTRQEKNPLQDRTQYILHGETSKQLWKANPNNPYIYVSFSPSQFLLALAAALGEEKFHKLLEGEKSELQTFLGKLSEINQPKIINKYHEIIQKEFIDRAKLPIKFLTDDASVDELIVSNVCFVMAWNQSDGMTSTILGSQQDGVQYRLMAIPEIDHVDEVNRFQIYNLLHEGFHCFAEGKHFTKHGPGDEGPFTSFTLLDGLDCADTVMAYPSECKSVFIEMLEAYAEKNSEIMSHKKFSYPDQLGPLDLEAMQKFLERWKQRNEESLLRTNPPNSTMEETSMNDTHTYVDSLYNDIIKESVPQFFKNTVMEYVIDPFANLCLSGGKYLSDCPGYFPKTSVVPVYSLSPISFFESSRNVCLNPSYTASIAGPPPVAYLGK